jgi:hypothetical protein
MSILCATEAYVKLSRLVWLHHKPLTMDVYSTFGF